MSGIYPHPSADASSFKVGDQVKWYVSEREISPYVGVVTQICPSINKLWVEFPIGGNQQKDPTELIIVTPFMGQSPVTEDTGYSDHSKTISDKNYGTIGDHVKEMALRLLSKKSKEASDKNKLTAMASKVANSFASDVVDRLASDVLACSEKGLTDIQAYQTLYPLFENVCSDGFMRTAIHKIYAVKNGTNG
jgi:hypothetical protein